MKAADVIADVAAGKTLLSPAEVGALYGSDPKTVTRWGRAGNLNFVTTPGGHRRYPAAQFAALIAQLTGSPS